MKNKCIICGKMSHLKKITLGYGTIYVCSNSKQCTDLLTFRVLGDSFPIMTMSSNDLYDYNNYEDDSNALRTCPLKKDEAEFLTSQDVIDIARIMSGYYWEESHSNTYTDDLWDATDAWRIKKEKEEEIKKIKSTTDKDLPLLLNTLKYDESKKVLEKRFKGTK